MLEDCLDHIKLKKNAGALEDNGHHIEGKKTNSVIKLKSFYSTWLLIIKKNDQF